MMLRRLWQASIWHPDAIDDETWVKRHDLRVWLPLYDIVAIGASLWAAAFGSPILLRLFPVALIEVSAIAMAFASTLCLIGVAFPRLWPMELAAKLGIVFLLGAYAGIVAFFPTNPNTTNGFVVFVLVLAMFTPFGRVTDLAEKVRQAVRDRVAVRRQKGR